MPPFLELYETDDATLAAADDLGQVAHGTTTAGSTWHLWNDLGNPGGDDATNLYLTVEERPKPSGGDPNPEWHQQGQATVGGWVEARVTGAATAGLEAQTTAWTPVGQFRRLSIFDIPADGYRAIEWRINVPQGVASEEIQLRLVVGYDEGPQPISQGFKDARANGVASHVGDEEHSVILFGGDLTEDSPQGANVQVSDLGWIYLGAPHVLLAHEITFSNQDGSAQALASGEEYIATLSGGDGVITVTKSDKGASPLPTSDRPALPAGEAFLGYVVVQFGLTIADADLSQQDRRLGRFGYEGAAGLSVTLGPGTAVVDDRLVRKTSRHSVALLASKTQTVYLLPTGAFENVESGQSPSEINGLALHQFVTDGSGVTAHTDLRHLADAQDASMVIHIPGTLAVSDKALGVYRGRRVGYLSLEEPIIAHLGAPGSGTGSTVLDVHVDGVTVFTSQGSDDRRPTIAQAASPAEDRTALPEVLELQPGVLVEVEVDAIPSNSDSADAVVLLRIHGE